MAFLRPFWAAAVAVVTVVWMPFGFWMSAKEILGLGLPMWFWQSVAFVTLVAMIGVMLSNATSRLMAAGSATPELAPTRVEKSWWQRLRAPKKANGLSVVERKEQLAAFEVQSLKERVAVLQTQHTELDKELRKASADRDGWQSGCQALEEKLRYGATLIAVPSMTDHEYVAIRPQLEVLQHSIDTVLDRANKVWAEVEFRCLNAGEVAPIWWLHRFVREQVVSALNNSVNLLRERLRVGRDPRPALAALYINYQELRAWIARLAKMIGPETGWGGYKEWYAADAQFKAELDKVLRISQLVEVRRAVDDFRKFQSEDYASLPEPGAPW